MALYKKYPALGQMDPMAFPLQAKLREGVIQAAPDVPVKKTFRTNERAAALHPETQLMRIERVTRHPGAQAATFTLRREDGGPAAWFLAGQYVSLSLEIGGSRLTRPYSLCASPARAKEGVYEITVRGGGEDAFASDWILANWREGMTVSVSGPQGDFVYEPLRDEARVVALAGGSGITPFLSMARAIRDGLEDFSLTILFGSRTEESILFRRELDELAAACPKIQVVHVLSDEEKPGFEHGFLTAALIEKYARGGPYSLFVCGPAALFYFAAREAGKLGLGRGQVRNELRGVTKQPEALPGYPAGAAGRTFRLTVLQYGERYELTASAAEPVLVAVERAGIPAPSRCRSGHCGWCRARLVSGEVMTPPDNDGRRAADLKNGFIHPCSAFPLSDLVIEIPEP